MALWDFTDEFEQAVDRWDGKVEAPTSWSRKQVRLRVFKNGFLEHVLATSHPALPGVWFGPFVLWGLYVAVTGTQGLGLGLGLFSAGVVGFSLLEYLLHRFPFHWPPGKRRSSKVRLFLMHGYHHLYPNDKWRLVAPPIMSWPLGFVVMTAYWLLLGEELAWILFGGTAVGYLAYDWIHYYTHHVRSPRTPIGKLLRRAHAVHHYRLFHLNMGISSPLWDFVFGTFAWSDATVKEAMAETRRIEAEHSAS
ncbi:MAG: sterol desaturase family protein [Myxococcales bacterium]|nr:sterol desaturase family protein [Myxococcales bacterium]